MPPTTFPRLRRKGKAFYFDTQGKPRRWIPLGSDPVAAVEAYRRLLEGRGRAGSVARMLTDYLDFLRAGGRAAKGRPVTAQTIDLYQQWSGHLTAVFGDMDPGDLTQGEVARYLANCNRTSFRGEISLLSSAYGWKLAAGELHFNPCIGVRSNRPRARRDRLITDAELAAIRARASPVLQIAIDLAHVTGLRVSDLVRVRWDDFGTGGEGFIRHAKTGFRQRFELTDDVRHVLDAARSLQGRVASLTVLAERSRPLTRHRLGVLWRKAATAAGVTDAQFRDVRAKAGTDEEAAGGDATKLLGHQSAATTKIYLRGKRIVTVAPKPRARSV